VSKGAIYRQCLADQVREILKGWHEYFQEFHETYSQASATTTGPPSDLNSLPENASDSAQGKSSW